jgi:hypothetical protein
MAEHQTKSIENSIENFRFIDTRQKRFINRLICYGEENIYDALRRRVLSWHEPGFVLCSSLEMPLGSGKTSAVLHGAHDLDKDFDIDSPGSLCFTANEMLEALKNLKKGHVVVWDEAGYKGGSARDWQKQINKTLNMALRLTRFKLGYVFITVPLASLLDRNIRLLTNISLEMLGVNHSKQLSYGIFRTLSLSADKYGRYSIIEKFPIRFHSRTSFTYISECTFPKVKPKLWAQYLKRKDEALTTLDISPGDNLLEENRRLKLQLRSTKGHLTRKLQQQNEKKVKI